MKNGHELKTYFLDWWSSLDSDGQFIFALCCLIAFVIVALAVPGVVIMALFLVALKIAMRG
jgi:hypothetical protein